jgi:aspartate/methionine/tyrosine aminotransferase
MFLIDRLMRVNLAHKHHLFIVADEVYQENTYLPDFKFHSFKKVLTELGAPYNQMEMGIDSTILSLFHLIVAVL